MVPRTKHYTEYQGRKVTARNGCSWREFARHESGRARASHLAPQTMDLSGQPPSQRSSPYLLSPWPLHDAPFLLLVARESLIF